MVTVKMEANDAINALRNVTDNLTKQLRIISWKVGNKAESVIAKQVNSRIAVKQSTVKKLVTRSRSGATGTQIELEKSPRIPIRDFGARQTRKGTGYRIAKTGKRGFVQGAFQGPSPNIRKVSWRGRVFRRVGKTRLPIIQLFGPSPWGVMVVNRLQGPSADLIEAELRKQMAERLRYLTLKKSGKI